MFVDYAPADVHNSVPMIYTIVPRDIAKRLVEMDAAPIKTGIFQILQKYREILINSDVHHSFWPLHADPLRPTSCPTPRRFKQAVILFPLEVV